MSRNMHAAVTEEQAAAEARAAGYEPQTSYPGRAVAAWDVICVECRQPWRVSLREVRTGMRCTHGEESDGRPAEKVSVRERRGYRPPVSPQEATAEAREAGYEPLERYPGNGSVMWSVRCIECGQPRSLTLYLMRSKKRPCAHRRPRLTPQKALAELREAGYEPVGEPPSLTLESCPVRCLTCRQTRRVTLGAVRLGTRCSHNIILGQPTDPDAELRAAGYEPKEPYPGTLSSRWKAVCIGCDRPRSVSLSAARDGRRCAHEAGWRRVDAKAAAAEIRAAGYRPLETYPGSSKRYWKAACIECGQPRTISVNSVRRGLRCRHLRPMATPRVAVAEIKAAGYEPLEPYPGAVGKPWRMRCVKCRQIGNIKLNKVREGTRCRHLGSGRSQRGEQGRQTQDRLGG